MYAVKEFADKNLENNDKWPDWHAAAGLNKDGAFVIDTTGMCQYAAVKLEGLPSAPYEWPKKGTKHTSALAAAYALRTNIHAVVVSSQDGAVHGLIWPQGGDQEVVVFGVDPAIERF